MSQRGLWASVIPEVTPTSLKYRQIAEALNGAAKSLSNDPLKLQAQMSNPPLLGSNLDDAKRRLLTFLFEPLSRSNRKSINRNVLWASVQNESIILMTKPGWCSRHTGSHIVIRVPRSVIDHLLKS